MKIQYTPMILNEKQIKDNDFQRKLMISTEQQYEPMRFHPKKHKNCDFQKETLVLNKNM